MSASSKDAVGTGKKGADAKAGSTKKPSQASAEETASPYPKMDLCQKMHQLTTGMAKLLATGADATSTVSALTELQNAVFQEIAVDLENPSLYRRLQKEIYHGTAAEASSSSRSIPIPPPAHLTEEELVDMETRHVQKMEELEAAVEEARESAGDMEVMEARVQVARFAAKSLSEDAALQAYQKLLDLPKVSSGKKIDALMESARLASFYKDTVKADQFIERASKLAEDGGGGDWDRRNRLKVYRALQLLLHRDMETAAALLLDCIATFSCSEICTYKDFIVYAILTNLLHLPRPALKEKIIDGPEILTVAPEIPIVIQLVKSFYDCDYKTYLHAMVDVEAVLLKDRYLAPHAAFWMRELHCLAYKQFLDSYQSVTLQAMATAFGVSTDFVDIHTSRFIASNRLSAKIDKYGGVIITNRPDLKNAQYREMIQKGDLLLNRIQKLARVVDL